MKFSIVTTSFNSGDKLQKTIGSVLMQDFQDYEIVVKDCNSKDGSVEQLRNLEPVKEAVTAGRLVFLICADKGVYDGMNQAISACRGDYVLFLNCGDVFHDEKVLKRTAEEIAEKGSRMVPGVFYGNTYKESTGAVIHSSPEITGFTCYRNIPCHQSCFYDRKLFLKKKYDLRLKIRGDYDHFLWCYYRGKAAFHYMDFIVADYEGGGISELEENRKTDKKEHDMVIRKYMSGKEILRYKLIMLLTLAPLRRWIAESSRLSGVYHKLKAFLYKKRTR